MCVPVPWETEWPKLSAVLREIPDDKIEKVEANPLAFLKENGALPTLSSALFHHTKMMSLTENSVTAGPRPSGVDHRKWQQIAYFTSAVLRSACVDVNRWVDWCAGKGHLGVAMHRHTGRPVHCLELNMHLVHRGNVRMAAEQCPVTFYTANVLKDDISATLTAETGVVALHACGQLNTRLFELATHCAPAFMAVVPCCYQRIDGMHFSPVSSAGKQTGLTFTRHQLRLPALDEVKSTQHRRAFRKREMAFRLGLDLLLRESSGADEYTPAGKIAPAMIRGSFESFCRAASESVQRELPSRVNWRQAEKNGWERRHLVSALSISRQLFRRPIEVWLFLDRVAHLEEIGFTVNYGEFCPSQITPRNLMLLARRS